jgi:hypothetical protein
MTPQEQLRTRPTFETAQDGYLRMLTDMRTALSAQVATLAWSDDAPSREDTALCREPFTKVQGATSAIYTSGDATGAVPDADWPQALSAVAEIAKDHGFTRVVTVVDKPGKHVVSIYDDYAAEVMFGTEVNTGLGVFGACFIAEAATSGP